MSLKKRIISSKEIMSFPSLRKWQSIKLLFTTLINNLYSEIVYMTHGTRRTDFWKEDDSFLEISKEVLENSLLNPIKLYALYQIAKNAANIQGDVAELGVYKGGSAKLLSLTFNKYSPFKKIFLFDTFSGLPAPDNRFDLHRGGDLVDVSYKKVVSYLSNCKNVVIYKGLFSETLPQIKDKMFSLVHIDVDLYSSVKECCEFFYSKVTNGGIMVFDDYGFVSCPGAKKAVDEFYSDKAEKPIYFHTGQCIVIKQLLLPS